MPPPRVSVIMPTLNGAAYVREALASVCAQTFRELEILVLDDGSEDDTLAIVSELQDARVRVEQNTTRLGLARNWNKGIQLTSGDYVIILHQDDRLAPEMMATQAARLEQHPNAGYAYSAYRLINDKGETLQIVKPFAADHIWRGADEFAQHLRKNYVQCPTVLVRRECYARLGGFNLNLRYALDWEMWMRIESHGYDVAYSAQVLADWRLHASSATRGIERAQDLMIRDMLMAHDAVFAQIPPEGKSLRALKRRAGYEIIKQSILRVYDSARHSDQRAVWRNLRASWIAFAHSGDVGFFPFVVGDALRFLRRARNPVER
jgi:glycosyltransferase involved in cell wall biosynthesis